MTTTWDPRANELFLEALKLRSGEERQEHLDMACAGDFALRAEVEALLEASGQAGSFLESPAVPPNLVATVGESSVTEQPGTMIGPYKLLEQIGEGGMGVVYIAEQQEPVRRRVALKIIKPGMDSRQVVARFEAERQALAMMDHPNIAKVFDGGAIGGEPGCVSTGRPYFVMELVKGSPITEYCDVHHLTTRQRLTLFLDVCHAVQHAHQKGIIHRDLKPSNILVSLHDVIPIVKVIDFGVAKATLSQLTDKSVYTALTQLIGTPIYMSPEQAGLSDLDVDTRSDVYSLGVLLYELLTGTTPFDGEALKKAGFDEMRRIIREDEPPRPSARLSTMPQAALSTIAERRGSSPRHISGHLRGELDWIIMRALEKDRNRRYETTSSFAADVQRYLDDEPIKARPSTLSHRVIKWGRRHKALMTAGLIVLFITTLTSSVSSVLIWSAYKGETKARLGEAKRRQQARDALDQMSSQIIEEWLGKQKELLPEHKEFLEKALASYEEFAADTGQDEVSREAVAAAYGRVGVIRIRLGESTAAVSSFHRSQQIYQQLAAEFPNRPDFRVDLAKGHRNLAMLFHQSGKLQEAMAAYAEALAIEKQLVVEFPARPDFHQALGKIHGSLGHLLHDMGKLQEAATAYTDALAIEKQSAADFPTRPDFRQDLANTHVNLGNLLHNIGKLAEAATAYADALAIEKQLVADFPTRPDFRQDLARTHMNLGWLLQNTGKLPQAATAYAKALAIEKQLTAEFPARPDFRQALARTHTNLGTLLSDTGKLPEAATAYADALAIEKQLVADFPTRPDFRHELAENHVNLGNLLDDMGKLLEAATAYADALAIEKQLATQFPTRPDFREVLAKTQMNLAILLKKTGKLPEAATAYADALAIAKQLATDFPTRPDFRQNLARTHMNLGTLFSGTGKLPEAATAHADALAIFKQLAADFPNKPDVRNELAGTFVNLAILSIERREFAAAKAYLEQAQPHHQAALEANQRNPVYRQFYSNSISALVAARTGLLDQAGAVSAAQQLRDLGWDPPANAYDAACGLALVIPIVEKHDQLNASKRQEAVEFYGDQALEILRYAVAKGYNDAAHMRKDTDLDPLRQRADFQKLMAELEKKEAKEKPETTNQKPEARKEESKGGKQ